MRVTFASFDDEPPLGGQGVLLRGMRNALRQLGVDVSTVAGHGPRAIRFPTVLHRAPLDFSLQLNRHARLLLEANPHVVHALGGPGGVLLLRRLPAPLVYTANHTYRQAYRRGELKRALGPLEKRAYGRAQTVLALSASTADALRAMGIPTANVHVLMPGVDIPQHEQPPREPGRVLFAGRLEPEKGVADAVVVLRALLRNGVAETGIVVGDGSLASEVRLRTTDEERIQLRGAISDSALHDEYARASLVLMPSRYEGLGLVALEAQAAGTPVAGYDVDGLCDAVQGDGALVEPGDRRALYDAAASLLRDPARAAALGERARERMRAEHSWDVIGSRLLQVYREALSA